MRWLSRGAAVGALLALLAACAPKPSFQNVDITGADYARSFDLTDFNGQRRTLADFKGDVVAVFFGYTQCPDVCPTSLAELAQVKQALGADGKRLQVVFISLDPERDTPAVLKAYLANFDKAAVGLYGTPQQTAQVAKEFKVFYQKVPGSTPGSYTVDHTAGSYVFDPQGRVRLFARYGADPKALLGDVKQLLGS
ncbi:MAG: SCO family protein [Betaproteobacteria bacterium]|nr:SCO family protein [Betaproteobacteria bacterium]MDE2049156.1 SCO family protein [Betaproteobacteria bacterium]